MAAVRMIALCKHPYGTGEREKGEEYQAREDEAKVLVALGRAKYANPKDARNGAGARPRDASRRSAET